MTPARRSGERGAAALEASVVSALVLVPLVVALVGVARWVEYRSAAELAAAEAARYLALQPEAGAAGASSWVAAAEVGHGLPAGSLEVVGVELGGPGETVEVRVVAHLPAIVVAFGAWGETELEVVGVERRPDFGAGP